MLHKICVLLRSKKKNVKKKEKKKKWEKKGKKKKMRKEEPQEEEEIKVRDKTSSDNQYFSWSRATLPKNKNKTKDTHLALVVTYNLLMYYQRQDNQILVLHTHV